MHLQLCRVSCCLWLPNCKLAATPTRVAHPIFIHFCCHRSICSFFKRLPCIAYGCLAHRRIPTVEYVWAKWRPSNPLGLGRKNDISMGVFEIHMLRQTGNSVLRPGGDPDGCSEYTERAVKISRLLLPMPHPAVRIYWRGH